MLLRSSGIRLESNSKLAICGAAQLVLAVRRSAFQIKLFFHLQLFSVSLPEFTTRTFTRLIN